MYYPEDGFIGKFRKYTIQPVLFGGGRYPSKGVEKGEYQSLEKARVDAVKLVKENSKWFYAKCFIYEYHRGYEGILVEKISWDYNNNTKKTGYYCEIEGKRTYRYKVNASTGTLGEKVKRKDLTP